MRLKSELTQWVLCVCLAVICIPANAQLDIWDYQCVDCPQIVRFGDGAMVLDSSMNPVVAYGGDQLHLSRFNGDTWSHEVLDINPGCRDAEVRLDEAGYVHVVYHDFFRNRIGYMVETDGGFQYEEIAAFPYLDLAGFVLDTEGTPHIIYVHSMTLYHTWKDATGWHLEEWQCPENFFPIRFHARGADGSLHLTAISNRHPEDDSIVYIYRDAAGWHYRTVDSITQTEYYGVSLILTGTGMPAIKYTQEIYQPEGNLCTLKYAVFDGVNFTIEDLLTGEGVISTTLCTNNGVYFSYYLTADNLLKLASNDGSVWNFAETGYVVPDGYIRQLCMDGTGNANMTFSEKETSAFQVLEQSDTEWSMNTVGYSEWVGYGSSLCFDSGNNPHIAYLDWTHNALKYGTCQNGIWDTSVVDDSGGYSAAIQVDNPGTVHIVYYESMDDGTEKLKYAVQDGTGWTLTFIDDSATSKEYISTDLDDADRLNVLYRSDRVLHHALRDGGDWIITPLDDEIDGGYPDMACGPGGVLHLSLWDRKQEGSTISYVQIDAAGEWQKELVTTTDRYGCALSIDVDPGGNPHMAYQSFGEYAVRYAYKSNDVWQIEIVDQDETIGLGTVISVDGNGYPHIAYARTCSDIAVKYAFRDDTGWHYETVATAWDWIAFALDNNGYPAVTYDLDGFRFASRNTLPRPETQGVRLRVSADYFYLDKPFSLEAVLYNHGPPLDQVPLFVLLELEGNYWFWPSWSQEIDWQLVDLPTGMTSMEIIHEFPWPDTSDIWIDGVSFMAALIDGSTGTIHGGWDGFDMKTLGFGEKVSCID